MWALTLTNTPRRVGCRSFPAMSGLPASVPRLATTPASAPGSPPHQPVPPARHHTGNEAYGLIVCKGKDFIFNNLILDKNAISCRVSVPNAENTNTLYLYVHSCLAGRILAKILESKIQKFKIKKNCGIPFFEQCDISAT